MKKNRIVIGTRGSKLALWQANWVKERLESLYPRLKIEIEKIKTTGDKILDAPLAKIGGKGLFVKEIEEALLQGRIHLAVHSMKDVPTEIPLGLHISAICEREDPRDVLISKNGESLKELLDGALVGTSSLRRTVQIKNIRKDLVIKPLRGNVDTRIRKLKEGEFHAIILALAGVKRMGYENIFKNILSIDEMIPAIGQGAIGIETRSDDYFINDLVNPLNHWETQVCVYAERAFLSVMGGGCQVPLACHARLEDNFLKIVGMIGDPEENRDLIKGSRQYTFSSKSSILEEAKRIGEELAEELLNRGGREILQKVYSKN